MLNAHVIYRSAGCSCQISSRFLLAHWRKPLVSSSDRQVFNQAVHRGLRSKHRWVSLHHLLNETEETRAWCHPPFSFIHLCPSFILHRSALLQKGHPGGGGSVPPDPGHSLRCSPGNKWRPHRCAGAIHLHLSQECIWSQGPDLCPRATCHIARPKVYTTEDADAHFLYQGRGVR